MAAGALQLRTRDDPPQRRIRRSATYQAARRSTDAGQPTIMRHRHAARTALWRGIMQPATHYQANICGGDFQHVKDCFETWKRQPLAVVEDPAIGKAPDFALAVEVAHNVLTQTCQPRDPYAIAAEIHDG
jgi:hypothetical protein